jgi:NAD(P)-dependent dehydrogenase (short-subunit alcohol dehydrogenase family)
MKITAGMVVFVTGGASGLGEATVRDLHAKGASVSIADLNQERMEMIRDELKERVIISKCDVTKENEVKDAIDLTIATFGALHVSLTCAGVMWPSYTLTSKSSLDMKIFE